MDVGIVLAEYVQESQCGYGLRRIRLFPDRPVRSPVVRLRTVPTGGGIGTSLCTLCLYFYWGHSEEHGCQSGRGSNDLKIFQEKDSVTDHASHCKAGDPVHLPSGVRKCHGFLCGSHLSGISRELLRADHQDEDPADHRYRAGLYYCIVHGSVGSIDHAVQQFVYRQQKILYHRYR